MLVKFYLKLVQIIEVVCIIYICVIYPRQGELKCILGLHVTGDKSKIDW